MQIELIGCTCAGKTTMARDMVEAGRQQGLDVYMAEDFVLAQVRLAWINNHFLRKLLFNLSGLFASAVSWRKNRNLYVFATKILLQLPISQLERMNLLRNVFKKLGISEIVRARSEGRQIILLDEGVLHVAHNLFVHVTTEPKLDVIPTFVSLLSLPDVILYVQQPESTLIERIIARGHTRIPNPSPENVASFVRRAVTTFNKLMQEPAVMNRLVILDGVEQVIIVARQGNDRASGSAQGIIQPLEPQYVA